MFGMAQGVPTPLVSDLTRVCHLVDQSIDYPLLRSIYRHHDRSRFTGLRIGVSARCLAGGDVLTRGLETLQRDMSLLFVELDEANLSARGTSARSLIEWLVGIGYSVIRADDRWRVTDCQLPLGCHFDIVCVAIHPRAAAVDWMDRRRLPNADCRGATGSGSSS